MQTFDVVVVGAGLAGLQCTRLLAGHGLRVLLVDRKASLEQAVHTTGIFVRRSFDDFALPPSCFGPPIRRVTLYSPRRRRLELASPHDEFRIGRMGTLYTRLLKDCQAAGATWLGGASYVGCSSAADHSLVELKIDGASETLQTRYLVAADGTQSRVARDLGLATNRRWIVGLEEVFEGVPLDGPPRLHCFLDHRLAPGYIAWVAEDGQSTHVGLGGYAARFQPSAALDAFRATLANVVNLRASRLVERRGGRIPVGGVLPVIANERGLAVGDAAGAVSPLTAGGLDPCLRLSELAAKVIWRYLSTGDRARSRPTTAACFASGFADAAPCGPRSPGPATIRFSKPACWRYEPALASGSPNACSSALGHSRTSALAPAPPPRGGWPNRRDDHDRDGWFLKGATAGSSSSAIFRSRSHPPKGCFSVGRVSWKL